MKYFVTLFLLFLTFCTFAQTPSKSAQDLFNEGNYLAAAAKYQKDIDNGNKDSYTFYNLANCYFKAGDLDKAIINYYRAFRLNPSDKDIVNNLSFTLEKTGQTLIPENMPKSIFFIYHYFSLQELKGLAFISLWIFAISLTFFVSFKYKPFLLKIVIASICLTIFFAGFYFIRAKKDLQDLAVVVSPRAELRSGPSNNFPVALNVPRAQILQIHDRKGDWIEVSLGEDGALNWVQEKSVEVI